jgi:hypothetical protein
VATPNLLATCTPYLPGVGKCRVGGGWLLITGKFGDRLLRAVIIYERLASGGCGDERGNGGIVECAWQAQAEPTLRPAPDPRTAR